MNLFTSTSESAWRKLLCLYALWTFGIGFVLAAAVIALDPYDSGRFALFASNGVPQLGQRLADASLGRDAQFDTAIIGNSTLQLIDPARLDASGIHAVSLTIPGTGPREQLAVADYFLRRHPGDKTRALVIGISKRWCAVNQDLEVRRPFPFWLYGNDTGDYLAGMMQYQSLESAGRKIRLMLDWTQPMHADGYNDYDAGRAWDRAGFIERAVGASEDAGSEAAATPPYHFAAVPLLNNFLARLPDSTSVVLVMPPKFHPETGMRSSTSAEHRACESAFRTLAARRPRTQLIDFLARGDLTEREDDYWDRDHYRARVARKMEEGIEEAVARER